MITSALTLSCQNPVPAIDIGDTHFTFTVADVGQGLAQFGVMDGQAVVWDVGPANRYAAWRTAYRQLGDPRINIIVISHSDEDHYGGLRHLDGGIDWGGELAVSPYEDTAKIRANSGAWRGRISFRMVTAGDTLKSFRDVEIVCLWPPSGLELELPLDGPTRNHYSLVFMIRHGHARALITSDIDSAAMRMIAVRSGYDLRADILSVPHHGSAGSVENLFFSYAAAETAVISCARQNSYGHPAMSMIDALTTQGAYLLYTYIDGTVTFKSNGWYW